MSSLLANAIYPLDYFTLAGVSNIAYPDNSWWSSIQRYAAVDAASNYLSVANGGTATIEYLEIDLGKVRQINYLNFDILRAPITVSVEYDPSSLSNSRNDWLAVTPLTGQPFENQIFFDGNNRTMWQNVDYFFTDVFGNIISTRYIRLGFARRDENWPVDSTPPFPWPVFVKHLRTGRYVADIAHTVGQLVDFNVIPSVEAITAPTNGAQTYQVRQQFVYPSDAVRGGIVPNILGFSIATQATSNYQEASFAWELWDVTNSDAPIPLKVGTSTGLVSPNQCWLDVYFEPQGASETQADQFQDYYGESTYGLAVFGSSTPDFVSGNTSAIYEIRVSSLTAALDNTFFTTTNNQLSTFAIPGTLTFTNGSTSVITTQNTTQVVQVGSFIAVTSDPNSVYQVSAVSLSSITLTTAFTGSSGSGQIGVVVFPYTSWNGSSYEADATVNLVVRVWGDVGDSGQDVLGNSYRYGVRTQAASNVTDNSSPGWMSMPKPSPDAVEALYFDIRGTDDEGNKTLTCLDAIEIDPRTPGVRMNIYYSRQGLQGATPSNQVEWDYLLWTPISHDSYTLRRHQTIDFPTQIYAGFIKLEFTGLRPLPYSLPSNPPLPAVTYNRFPTWVETQFNNAQVKQTVNDWFLRNATPVQTRVLQSLSDPIQEFEYEQQAFLAALASGQATGSTTVNSQIVIAPDTIIDPETSSQIYISDSTTYSNTLLLTLDQSSVLGQIVMARYNPNLVNSPGEQVYNPQLASTIPVVSAPGNRLTESYQTLAQTPMRFNKTCRHIYAQEESIFNKKAYFVGIQSVNLVRANKSIARDDPYVLDDLYDDLYLTENTWIRDNASSIPDPSTVYVSYNIGDARYTDEEITLIGTLGTALANNEEPATSVTVFAQPYGNGTEYFQVGDYDLFYGMINGQRVNFISRANTFNRLVVPTLPITWADTGLIIGHGEIPSPPIFEAGTIIGIGMSSGNDAPFVPNYGTGTYGDNGVGTYADMQSQYTESNTAVGTGEPSGSDIFTP